MEAMSTPPFEGVCTVLRTTSQHYRDNRDYKDTPGENAGTTGSAPHNDEEADVASQARDAVRRPPGIEKRLRERQTNSSSGDVLRVRRLPGPAASGATQTGPTQP